MRPVLRNPFHDDDAFNTACSVIAIATVAIAVTIAAYGYHYDGVMLASNTPPTATAAAPTIATALPYIRPGPGSR